MPSNTSSMPTGEFWKVYSMHFYTWTYLWISWLAITMNQCKMSCWTLKEYSGKSIKHKINQFLLCFYPLIPVRVFSSPIPNLRSYSFCPPFVLYLFISSFLPNMSNSTALIVSLILYNSLYKTPYCRILWNVGFLFFLKFLFYFIPSSAWVPVFPIIILMLMSVTLPSLVKTEDRFQIFILNALHCFIVCDPICILHCYFSIYIYFVLSIFIFNHRFSNSSFKRLKVYPNLFCLCRDHLVW